MPRLHRYMIDIIAALLLLIYLYTAISKLSDTGSFEVALGNAPVIDVYDRELSFLIPLLEILICVLLFFPRTRYVGLCISFLLLCLFTAYIFYLFASGSNLPCRCGGVIEQLSWKEHLVFNIVLMSLNGFAIYCVAIHRRSRTPV